MFNCIDQMNEHNIDVNDYLQVYIPVNVPQLKSLPNYHIAEMWRSVKQTMKKYTPTEEYSIWDTFYKYKPSSDMNDWIPPFKGVILLLVIS